MAMALLFRYADFITLLGGSEWHLGWIVGIGMVGSLAMRLAMGSCIDHYRLRAWSGFRVDSSLCGHVLRAPWRSAVARARPSISFAFFIAAPIAGVFGRR